jgi:hypothetical protein
MAKAPKYKLKLGQNFQKARAAYIEDCYKALEPKDMGPDSALELVFQALSFKMANTP